MENRFGVKDFFLFLLLISLIVIVLLAMKQYDRQYEIVNDLKQQGRDQLRELVAIHSALDRGVSMSGPTTRRDDQGPDPFAELRKLRGSGGYNQGDWLVQNFGAAVAKVTPLLSTDVYASIVQARVIESLAYRSPDTLDWIPLLATSWSIKDNSTDWQAYVDKRKLVPIAPEEIVKESDCPPAEKADARKAYIDARLKEGRRPSDIGAEPECPPALSIIYQIREGVTFSDGSPLTADDVVFTYEWTMNPKIDAPRDRQALDRIKSVQKNSDYQVTFNFKEPFFQSFELASSMGILSKSFYSKYTPDQFNASVGLLIGTGPYRLESPTDWKPNPGKIELLRNERYWGLQSSFDRLVFHQIESDTTSLVMFTNGELDAEGLQPQQYQLMLKRPEVVERTQHFEYMSPISGYSYIAWNQQRNGKPTIFTDRRVRQAMTMLTDREGICKNILLGYAIPARGPFNPQSKQDDKSLQDWTYDPAQAKSLLHEIGFDDRDGSGVLKLADGTPLAFKLSYPSKNETQERIMKYIKDGYSRAGVLIELDPVDWTIIEQRLKRRDFDAISLGWTAGLEDDIYQMFDSSQIANEADDFMSYANPALDTAIRQARRTLDESKRIELWHQCERIIHDDQPYTFLINRKSLRFFDKRIANIKPAKTGLNFVLDWVSPIPWYVPTAQQKYTK